MSRVAEKKFRNGHFKDGDIYVLWNVEDYPPIPENTVVEETRKTSHNIITALRRLGSVGTIYLFSFDNDPQMERESVLMDAGFYAIEPIGYKQGERTMLETMISFLTSYNNIEPPHYDPRITFDDEPEQRPIYVVIAKDNPEGELYRTLRCLKRRGMQIVLLKPAGDYYTLPSVRWVMECGELLDDAKLTSIPMHQAGFGEMDWEYTDNPASRSHCSLADIISGIKSMRDLV